MIMNRLTMLAVTLMASMACFAQGKFATTIGGGKAVGDEFDYLELKYKVLDNASGYTVEVIGFSDAFQADPTLFDTSDEITAHNTVSIPHYIGESTDVAVKTYIQSIAAGALNTSDATLASKVTAMTIDYVDNDKTQGLPITIGANAFAGLTSLATVENFTPGSAIVGTAKKNSFANNVYNVAELIVPEGAIFDYSSKTGWKSFLKMSDGESIRGDVDGDGIVDDYDYSRIIYYFNKNKYNKKYDLDGDGVVDDYDASLAVSIFNVR